MNKQLLTPFNVKDCTLAAIATGVKAQTLSSFRDRLAIIHPSSIYYHFWGGRLRVSFEYREYHNDFSHWAHHSLHDEILAERLELFNPTEYSNIDDLRAELLDVIDNRLDEREFIPFSNIEDQFHFIKSKIVIFQTRHVINQPSDLLKIIPLLTRSSLFYHFIDSARRMASQVDDFSTWLQQDEANYKDLIAAYRSIDPYTISLSDLQNKLIKVTIHFFEQNPPVKKRNPS